ncbi:MAG: FkbM family methyltransferase [Chitinophagaceae bacterium]|nr:FkbM family methyltransferase [Chitinophagaceae bacterium]
MNIANSIRKQWIKIFPGPQAKRVKPWFAADGDYRHRLFYDSLNRQSVVVDLGGYKGQWASDIFGRYLCKVYVFEPADYYFKLIRERFTNNPDVNVYQVALSNENKTEQIFINADRSSSVKKVGVPEPMHFRKFDEMMKELQVQQVDLLKINIEGGEYDLLEYIISTGWIKNIDNLQIQFHDFFHGATERMNKIQASLALTHSTTYQYEFVWENWKRK